MCDLTEKIEKGSAIAKRIYQKINFFCENKGSYPLFLILKEDDIFKLIKYLEWFSGKNYSLYDVENNDLIFMGIKIVKSEDLINYSDENINSSNQITIE